MNNELRIQGLIDEGEDPGCEFDPELMLQATLDNPNLVQQITRTREDGDETFVGYFRVEFAPDQTRQVLHVPFVPPFGQLPRVDAHASDHGNVRIRITDCQKFGLRLEIVLSQASGDVQNPMIEIIATEGDEVTYQ